MPYYSREVLKGFDSYKYSARDTSPLSIYVMHPFWDWVTKFYPLWLAPNLLTFIGFLLVCANFLLTCYYDWSFYSSSPNHPEHPEMPGWIWFVMFVFHFASHTLDGTDGKQAKRTKSSSPLGELFDHGVDSLSTVFMPVAIFSVFGRGHHFGGDRGVWDMHGVTWCVFLTFALAHWEKYNTQELYLPWGYDIALLGIAAVYLATGFVGTHFWRFDIFQGYSMCRVIIYLVYFSNFALSVPVSFYNIYKKYRPENKLKYGLYEGLVPLLSFVLIGLFSTSWIMYSPNNIAELEPRMFIWIEGVLFSSHACRLIIAQMTSTQVPPVCNLVYAYVLTVLATLFLPPHFISLQTEYIIVYSFAVFATLAHLHFGVSVVREIASHLNVSVFSIKQAKH